MSFSPAQNTVIKNDIAANSDLNIHPDTAVGNQEIADKYNLQAAPAFTVWKSNLTIREIATCFVGTELAGLTANNHTRLATVAAWFTDGMDPSKPDMRAMLDDIFSGAGGTGTRARLLVLYKRLSSRIEKLLATGTGSDAVPATAVYEGKINSNEVETARRS